MLLYGRGMCFRGRSRSPGLLTLGAKLLDPAVARHTGARRERLGGLAALGLGGALGLDLGQPLRDLVQLGLLGKQVREHPLALLRSACAAASARSRSACADSSCTATRRRSS